MQTNYNDEYKQSRFWVIVEAALEYFISIITTGAYLARITKALEFSDSLTGVLSSFVSLGCIFQLGTSVVFKGVRRVKSRVILFQMINQLLFVVVYVAPVLKVSANVKTAVFLGCFITSYILINLIRSRKTHWHLTLVDNKKRGIFSAKKEIVSLIGGMTYTYVMGSIVDGLEAAGNTKGAFTVCAITILVLSALHCVSLILIREKPAEQSQKTAGIRDMLEVAKDKNLKKAVLMGVIWSVAYYVSTPFYGAYQIQELKFTMRFISVLSIVYSIARALISPYMGKYADRHSFSRMVTICFVVSGAGYFVNMFLRPENGKVIFLLYNLFSAVSMAGINSSLVNIVYDFAPFEKRTEAIALNSALCGVVGFLTTCAAGSVVSLIQANGNRLFGISLYPAQFTSGISVVVIAGLVLYMKKVLLPLEKKRQM